MGVPKGLDVPFHFSKEKGYPVAVEEEELLDRSIKSILLTVPGERPFRPGFGSWLSLLVFANMSEVNVFQARSEIRRALADWEPRVDVGEILFEMEESTITLTIHWQANGRDLDSTTFITFEV